MLAVYMAFIAGLLSLLYAAFLSWKVISAPKGTDKIHEISKAIQEGANAFLTRQYKTLLPIVVILFVIITFGLNVPTGISFLAGVLSSALAGYIGMQVSVRGNVRVAEAAKKGLNEALGLAFKGGAVTGMALTGLGLLGL